MTTLLETQSINAGYGKTRVLRDLSIRMAEGERIGLFGPNGHGKTTLLRCISGLLRPTDGKIAFDGTDIRNRRASDITGMGLVHSQQGNTLFGDMTVRETIELAAFTPRARPKARQTLDYVHTLFPRLAERHNQKVKTLSGGERQMLSIGAALMCAPKLLMLDEPTLGLSPKLKEELATAIIAIADSGMSLIVVEQDIEFLLSATEKLYMIEHGEIQREIDQVHAPDHTEIMQMYFGVRE